LPTAGPIGSPDFAGRAVPDGQRTRIGCPEILPAIPLTQSRRRRSDQRNSLMPTPRGGLAGGGLLRLTDATKSGMVIDQGRLQAL
jgi:hypothetical protein